MEKFGIFELLDALSAIAAAEEKSPPSAEDKTAEEKQRDGAFAPPVYGGPPAPDKTPAPARETALADFLARHDAIARKTKK